MSEPAPNLRYIHGREGNDPIVSLAVCLDLIKMYVPDEVQHPACQREIKRAEELLMGLKEGQVSEPQNPARNPELQAALDEAKAAIVGRGNDNDAEHDALISILAAFGLVPPECIGRPKCDFGKDVLHFLHSEDCPAKAWQQKGGN